MLTETFSANLFAYRKLKSLGLKQVSDITGVSIANISKIERGESSPTLETVEKIAKGLGLEVGEMLSAQFINSVEFKRQATQLRDWLNTAIGKWNDPEPQQNQGH